MSEIVRTVPHGMTSDKRKKIINNTIVYILIAMMFLTAIFPLFFAVLISFLRENAIPMMFIDSSAIWNGLTFDNYIKVYKESGVGRWFLNSCIVAISQTVLYLLIASMAAFAFARLKWKGRDVTFKICLASMMVPGIVNIVPNYIIVSSLGLYNIYLGLILPGLSGVYGVFFLRQYMIGIPKDYDESARVDGANNWQIFTRIILPMSKPAVITIAISSFQGAWNDFLWPLIITGSEDMRTLASGLYVTLLNDSQYKGSLMASSIVSALPILLIFIFGQKYFVEGLSGGIKE